MGICPSCVSLSLGRSTCLSLWPSWGRSGALFLCLSLRGKGSSLHLARSVYLFIWEVLVYLCSSGQRILCDCHWKRSGQFTYPGKGVSQSAPRGCFPSPGFLLSQGYLYLSLPCEVTWNGVQSFWPLPWLGSLSVGPFLLKSTLGGQQQSAPCLPHLQLGTAPC